MNHLDLFSGIGGFALAARLAGWEFNHSYFSDIEEYANSIYQKNFPEAKPLGDIKQINGKTLKETHEGEWIVTGGFPCQDVSTAGKRKGLNSNRSGLWFEMLRVITELRPQFCLIENVSALCCNGLDRVLVSLAKCGYDAEWQTISAEQAGAPHLRKRIWIIAYPSTFTDTMRNGNRATEKLPESKRNMGKDQQPDGSADGPGAWSDREAISATTTDSSVYGCEVPSKPHSTSERRDLGDRSQPYGEADGPGAWPDWHTTAAKAEVSTSTILPRMDDGIPGGLDRNLSRVHALGNAIVPQVAVPIFRRLWALQAIP